MRGFLIAPELPRCIRPGTHPLRNQPLPAFLTVTKPTPSALEARLIAIARSSHWFMDALTLVRSLDLPDWCIGAGAVRNLAWDALHGYESRSALSDLDVAYFDSSDISPGRDARIQRELQTLDSVTPWEVTNQAGVHQWFEAHFGHAVEPLHSLDEAVASWPEFCTAVGICLNRDGSLRIIAPHGLEDLFGIVVRRNPARVSVDTYRERIAAKRYAERWPRLTIVPCR